MTMARTSSKAKHIKLRHRRNIQEGMRGLRKAGARSPAWLHGQGGSMKPHSAGAK